MPKLLDMVIFGATGVTGQYVIRELSKVSADEGGIRWAVAGRDADKLKKCLENILGENGKDIPIIMANVDDPQSIQDMCKQTKIVLNTVGPYRFFGEQVVKACIENGSHHFDVSGEPQYLESIQLKYYDDAKNAGVYIVGACGFDSIPCDVGVAFLKEQFGGDLNSVEVYHDLKTGEKGTVINFGTWQSAIYGVAHSYELKTLRKDLSKKPFMKALPESQYKLQNRGILFKSDVVNGWCIPFLGSDKSVVTRSQMANYALYNEKPVQIRTYIRIPSFVTAVLSLLCGMIFMLLAKCSMGRKLLENYPEFLSFGLIKKGGPTEEQVRGNSFSTILRGSGWNEKLSEVTDQHTSPPNKELTVCMKGPDPGYVSTSAFLVQSAMVTLKEPESMPKGGGVYTPATAFGRSTLINRLKRIGMELSIVNN